MEQCHSGNKRFSITWLLYTALLLLTAMSPIATAEAVNDLSEVEQANVDTAIEELKKLIKKCKERKPKPCQNAAWIAQFEAVIENLEQLNAAGKIKSVPGLNDDDPKKYRYENGRRENPKAAFCPPGRSTQIFNETTNTWEDCPPGTLIFDSSLLDPGVAGGLDPECCGWEALWELADILYHEKWHEFLLTLLLEEEEEEEARILAEGKTAHARVYEHHKNLVKMHKKLIEEEKKEEKKKRPKDQDKIDNLTAKEKWLKERLETIRKARNNALRNQFDEFHQNESCHLPAEPVNGVLSMHILTLGGYWQMGILYENATPVNYSFVEEAFGDEVEQMDPLPGVPTSWLVMTQDTFTRTLQTHACDVENTSIETEEITVLTSGNAVFNLIPRQMTFSFIDAFDDTPLEDAKIQMFDSSDNMVAEFDPSVNNGEYTGVFAPDDYYFEVSTELFWTDIILQETRVISTGGEADIIIFKVDLVFIKLEYLDWLVYGAAALFLLGVASRVRRFGRPSLPSAAPMPPSGGGSGGPVVAPEPEDDYYDAEGKRVPRNAGPFVNFLPSPVPRTQAQLDELDAKLKSAREPGEPASGNHRPGVNHGGGEVAVAYNEEIRQREAGKAAVRDSLDE